MKLALIVLAAGMGSRYGGLKQMDGLGPNGETIIDYSIFDAVRAGFSKIVYIVRESFREEMQKSVVEKYGNLKCPNGETVEFHFVTQELDKIPQGHEINPNRIKPWGTAHALLMAKDLINEPFAVINGDDFYGRESFSILAQWLLAHSDSKRVYSIIGFKLENTLSESGSVSRGVCEYDDNNLLTNITEHLEICKNADGSVYGDNSTTGEKHVRLRSQDLCSMNMWGFTPDFFSGCTMLFESFLDSNGSDLKKEFYIPFVINDMIKSGECRCEIIQTPSKWFGVTYKEDRPAVVAQLQNLTKNGVYPLKLY